MHYTGSRATTKNAEIIQAKKMSVKHKQGKVTQREMRRFKENKQVQVDWPTVG